MNQGIVHYRDARGWTWQQIATLYGVSVPVVREAYDAIKRGM